MLDSLRALAIIGVIFIHVTGMVMTYRAGEVMAAAGALDTTFAVFDLGLIIDKARSCFAFLFGVSFGVLIDRAEGRSGSTAGFYLRRMAGLLAFGVVNQAFLFFGDILVLYAVLGSLMILFRRWSDRALLAVGLSLIALPAVVQTMAVAGGWTLPAIAFELPGEQAARQARSAAAYESARYLDVVRQNLLYPLDRWRLETGATALSAIGVLGLFMLGFWWARRGILFRVDQHRPFLLRLAWIGLPIGLILSLVTMAGTMGVELGRGSAILLAFASLGGPVMALGYVAFFALLFTNKVGPAQRLLAPLGRVSLTAYLGSALIAGPVLYGYGFGLGATIGLTQLNLLAIFVIAVLILFAHIWLSRFQFGPLEWIWRSFTYGSLQPLLATHKDRPPTVT